MTKRTKNLLLALLSVGVTWPLLEQLRFPLALPLLPLRIHTGLPCVDTRPALWEAGATEPIHRPRDWRDLSRVGQEQLAAPVVSALGRFEPGGCASLRIQLDEVAVQPR